ncbi:MAG: hypothetical protein AMJ66_05460 [Betaproteobacteria bacterium SG8_40]|nr:MAG: hypothetical protein AMJ66_05460 [Betaproteobacteria bacterium SG8_40]
MNEDNFNMSIRKFLKMTGVGSQREIEQAVAKALAEGKLEGIGKLPVSMKLTIPSLDLDVSFDGDITLE